MKQLLISSILFLLFFSSSAYSQAISLNIEEAKAGGINITELDKEYPSAASAKPNKGVFKDKQLEFMQAYHNLLREVAVYLNDKGIDWGKNTIFVHRIYFSKDGFINYFLFNTPNKNLDNDKIKKHLTEFSKDYRFPVTSDTNFRQCGTAPFRISQ